VANKKVWDKQNEELAQLVEIIHQLKTEADQRGPDETDCQGMPGYESEKTGDGLLGYYYDNEQFQGSYLKRTDENINLNLNNEAPMEGINFENFSIKWAGFLRIPKSGSYVFVAKSDDGHELLLNG